MPITVDPQATTQASGGVVTAPAVGTAIATIASANLPAGMYTVFVVAGYGAGTAPAAAENANMQLQKGAAVLGVLALPGAITVVPFTFIVYLDGTQTLTVNSVAAATGGVAYMAGIYAYRFR